VYRPPELQHIRDRISVHIEEATKFERQNRELQEALARQHQQFEETKERLAKAEENFQSTLRDMQNTQLV
jgi:hypothetical protein